MSLTFSHKCLRECSRCRTRLATASRCNKQSMKTTKNAYTCTYCKREKKRKAELWARAVCAPCALATCWETRSAAIYYTWPDPVPRFFGSTYDIPHADAENLAPTRSAGTCHTRTIDILFDFTLSYRLRDGWRRRRRCRFSAPETLGRSRAIGELSYIYFSWCCTHVRTVRLLYRLRIVLAVVDPAPVNVQHCQLLDNLEIPSLGTSSWFDRHRWNTNEIGEQVRLAAAAAT